MKWLILVHVLGASVWVGGHLILSIGFLPRALQSKDINIITGFEKSFERIGIPALLAQIITGLWMASLYIPPRQWFSLASVHHQYLWIKHRSKAEPLAHGFLLFPGFPKKTFQAWP
ncbi:MAG TPA: hypothetical protein PKH83_05260, partial [Cyclobacteriaceae bacterium]|nr:hypothetical protein [Cyclobacteriaceae bacterium]